MSLKAAFFAYRRFFHSFNTVLFEKLFGYAEKHVTFEVADLKEIKQLEQDRKIIIYLSHRSSIIEQFLLNGFFLSRGIKVPSHSFGPKTVLFFTLKDALYLSASFFSRKKFVYSPKITGLYIPLEDHEFFTSNPAWAEFVSRFAGKDCFAVPVTTIWNKDVPKRKNSSSYWLLKYIGKYNFWATFTELFYFILGRRRLTLRIGLAEKFPVDRQSPHLYEKLYKILQNEKKQIVGVSLKNWLEIKNETLFSLGEAYPPGRTRRKIEKDLNSIITRYSPSETDRIARLTGRVLNSLFSRLYYEKREIDNIRRLAAMHNINIVFIPTHKSYFDYLILFSLLYREQVTVPLVAAGDNLSFFPLGPILRKMGAFFIRRKIGDDTVYATVFKEYLRTIIEAGYNIEFFIEGGRSRSGRVRIPRTGMMQMLSELKKETGRRIYVVPVSITYEQLHEIQGYSTEHRDGKEPERKGFFPKMLKLFRMKYGPAYVTFGKPLYLSPRSIHDFSFQLSSLLEGGGYVSFSGLFSSFFLAEKDVNARALPRKMSQVVEILRKLPSVKVAPALSHLDLNVPRLIERLRETGTIHETKGRPDYYRLKLEARDEFTYYKNTVFSVFVPLLLPFITRLSPSPQAADIGIKYLESIFKIREEMIAEYDRYISDSDLPEWFILFLFQSYEPYFIHLRDVLEFLPNKKVRSFSSKSDAVKWLVEKIRKEKTVVNSDDIYDCAVFLEHYTGMDNFLAISPEIADTFLVQTNILLSLLRRDTLSHENNSDAASSSGGNNSRNESSGI